MHQEWQCVQETVQSWEYDDENYLFVFGDEVSADVQRRETHSCTDRGTSRSECQCGYVSELTTRITAPLQFRLFDLQLNGVDTRKYTGKSVIWLEK